MQPITEEDKPNFERIIKSLSRYRKRQTAQPRGEYLAQELTDAINSLHDYGATKEWWEYKD